MKRARPEPEETEDELRERLRSLRDQLARMAALSPAERIRDQIANPPGEGIRIRRES